MASAAIRLFAVTRPCSSHPSATVSRCVSTSSRPGLAIEPRWPTQGLLPTGRRPTTQAAHWCLISHPTVWRSITPQRIAKRPYSDEPSKVKQDQTPPEQTKLLRSSIRKLRTHEDIYNLPNLLTVTRLIAAPTTAYLLIHDYNNAALALFAYAGITDFIDGWLARRWKLSTVAGSVMDPMADKALMIILTATLAVKGALPLALATLILGRDASMGVAAIYYRWASLPAPKTFMRYWDFSLPSAEVRPTQISKQNTFLQLILIGSTLALPVVTAHSHHLGVMHDLGLGGLDLHAAMTWLQVTVAATTIWSGLSYVTNTEAVRMLPRAGDDAASGKKDRRGLIGRSIIGATFGSVILLAAYQMNESIRKEMMEDTSETAPKQPSR